MKLYRAISLVQRSASQPRETRMNAYSYVLTVVSYGDVMEVMGMLRAAGYLKVALVGLETRNAK